MNTERIPMNKKPYPVPPFKPCEPPPDDRYKEAAKSWDALQEEMKGDDDEPSKDSESSI